MVGKVLVGIALAVLFACSPSDSGDDDDDARIDAAAGSCGNGMCDPSENCFDCEQDCGVCAVCGNGTCDGLESCQSCEIDCGLCDCANDGGPCECFLGDGTCVGDEVCVHGTCEYAWNRPWVVTVVSAKAAARNPEGDLWDPDGTAPDPYAEIWLNGDTIYTTAAITDTLSPTWNESLEVVLPATTNIWFTVMDKDVTPDELVYACGFNPDPLHVLILRFTTLTCTLGENELNIRFDLPK